MMALISAKWTDAQGGTNLVDDWFKDLSAQEIAGDGKFSVDKSDGRIIRILDVEARKVEHFL